MAGTMKIENIELKKLKLDPDNPNNMTEKQIDALTKSIKDYGDLVPIIIDKENNIIDGEQRFKAYNQLNVHEVPVIRLNLVEKDKRILRQILNKLKGSHDIDKDREEFKRLLELTEMEDITNHLALSEQSILNLVEPSVEKVDKLYTQKVTCPKCGFEFEKKE